MQSVSAAFTAEETDYTRRIAQNTQISWKKFSTLGNSTFTIGVSLVGGNDVIGINPGAIGSPANYQYFDESDYVMSLAWERGLSVPTGGLSKAYAEGELDNTSDRFTPRYMGGNSELFTSILPRRPVIINAGFDIPPEEMIPQFTGAFNSQPTVDKLNKTVNWRAADYIDFFENRQLDHAVMFTGQTTDQVMETLLRDDMGLSTAQYDLDPGINAIPFGIFEVGTKFHNIFHDLSEAENGYFYQDELGIFRFDNRQHWDTAPNNSVSRILLTSQVLQAETPSESNIINVVEIRSSVLTKQPEQIIFRLNPFDSIELPVGTTEVFVQFEDPALSMTTPTSSGTQSYFIANTLSDGSGADVSTEVAVSRVYKFANSAKIEFTKSGSGTAFITNLVITGRVAKKTAEIYTRATDSLSLTAYEERLLTIDNPFIQSQDWAESYAQMLLNDYAEPENMQRITIRAIPELQLGDLVSWQGRYWRIYDIKTKLDPDVGFTQELTMLQRNITTYFRIGISTIAGPDSIAP